MARKNVKSKKKNNTYSDPTVMATHLNYEYGKVGNNVNVQYKNKPVPPEKSKKKRNTGLVS